MSVPIQGSDYAATANLLLIYPKLQLTFHGIPYSVLLKLDSRRLGVHFNLKKGRSLPELATTCKR